MPKLDPAEAWMRALAGDREAFEQLAAGHADELRAVVRRLVCARADVDVVVHDAVRVAYERLGEFEGGVDDLRAWLLRSAARLALEHLHQQRRWRQDAHVGLARRLHASDEGSAELSDLLESDGHRFDAREHIAYCFACVGRSLPPDDYAPLALCDLLGYDPERAAEILDEPPGRVRHSLAVARRAMQARLESICGLVNPQGVCHQCTVFRTMTPQRRRGQPVPELTKTEIDSASARYVLRVKMIHRAELDRGRTQKLHDMLWARLASEGANG